MSKTTQCDCGRPMENLGNVSGVYNLSFPASWNELHVCHFCHKKRTLFVRAEMPEEKPDYSIYEEIK